MYPVNDLERAWNFYEQTLGSIAFEVDDLDRLVSELKEKNIEFKLDNIVTPVCKMAVILDSEGNALTLHQLTKSW